LPSSDKLRKEVDSRLTTALREGNRSAVRNALEQMAERQGVTLDVLLEKYPEVRRELELMAEANGSAATATEFLADEMFLVEDALDLAELRMQKFAEATDRTKEEVEELIGAIQSGSRSIFDPGAALEHAYRPPELDDDGNLRLDK